jgi:serine/threonine protein phosphatase PrpC
VALGRGDVLVLATDGLRGDFATGVSVQGSAQTIADRILAASSRGHDDALVLVARFLGPGE